MSEIKVMNYIDGEFCEASTRTKDRGYGPMDGKVIASIPRSGADDVFERCNVQNLLRKIGLL